MNIYEALKSVDEKKAEYFKYLHPELRFDHSKPLKSEEDFLRLVDRKSMAAFHRWEKSHEYKHLIILYLDYKVNQDYEKIYNIVSETALKGDEKSIRLFITLQKDIQQNAKLASKTFTVVEDEEETEDDDGLVLD